MEGVKGRKTPPHDRPSRAGSRRSSAGAESSLRRRGLGRNSQRRFDCKRGQLGGGGGLRWLLEKALSQAVRGQGYFAQESQHLIRRATTIPKIKPLMMKGARARIRFHR